MVVDCLGLGAAEGKISELKDFHKNLIPIESANEIVNTVKVKLIAESKLNYQSNS